MAIYDCSWGSVEIIETGGAISLIRPADQGTAGALIHFADKYHPKTTCDSINRAVISPAVVSDSGGEVSRHRSTLTDRAHREICEYLRGERREFTFPIAPQGTPFRLTVWEVLCSIPYGKTMTYGELAAVIGSPGSSRAVGNAAGANPLWIVIPCHRLVGANALPGGYRWGEEMKLRLLDLEQSVATQG